MTASVHRFPITIHLGIAIAAFLFGLFMGRSPSALAATGDALIQPAAVSSAATRIVVQNTYFPKVGMEDEVLATRLEASAVRARSGLVEGRVLMHVEGPDDAPYIMWEAEYESAEARAADVAALEDTDFSRVSSHMGTLLDRFGRRVWEVVEPG